MRKREKKGLSPVIATVLLIVIVLFLALIIFLWARGFIKENVMKKGENADQACDTISLEAIYDGNELQISNNGNIPVYRFEIKKKSAGNVELERKNEQLRVGESTSFSIGSYDELEIYPAILGESGTSKTIYTCKNKISPETL